MQKYVLKIYKGRNFYKIANLVQRYHPADGGAFVTVQYNKPPDYLINAVRRNHLNYLTYPSEYERSANYRQVFFERNPGPYRCRYCGKKLKRGNLQVDHIIPVAGAQRSHLDRALLRMHGCETVNSPKNLAPACEECNRRKSDKGGLWILRGHLGQYKGYWVFVWIVRILFLLFLLYLFYAGLMILNIPQFFREITSLFHALLGA